MGDTSASGLAVIFPPLLFNRLFPIPYSQTNVQSIYSISPPSSHPSLDIKLQGMIQSNASYSVYTTFIGIGLDFEPTLVEEITKVRGCNYYSVQTAAAFKKRLKEEFKYMVTPLVFDLSK